MDRWKLIIFFNINAILTILTDLSFVFDFNFENLNTFNYLVLLKFVLTVITN